MSKIVKGLEKIEEGVVKGYKKIENGVVGGFKTIEDKFVDTFLKKDGETIETAKKRINKEHEELRAKQAEMIKENQKYSKSTEEIQAEINKKYGINK